MASNSSFPTFVFSTIKLLKPLWASKTRTMGFEFINRVNIFLLISGVVPISFKWLCNFVDETPFV